MSKEYIVTISEGEKTEKQIIENLQTNFFNINKKKELVILSFKTNIYALWKVMKEDEFETNIIDVLEERDNTIRNELESIKESISEVYLFFDYDGQAYKKDEVDDIIFEMIRVFDNETENGKIYISYPMVEAIKDLKIKDVCSRRCSVPAKENIHYKALVSKDTDFCNLTTLKVEDWYFISEFSLKKANCIVSSSFRIPTYSEYKDNINQVSIFNNQLNKFINFNQTVAVLGGFSFFLIDYFGENLYKKIIEADGSKIGNEIKNECCKKQ